jgi:hypothetical protein
MVRQVSKMLALACFLLGWVTPVGFPPALAGDNGALPKTGPAGAKATGVQPKALPSGTVAADTALLQRRRQAIAQMLEGNIYFRTLFDVKLINAKLAGPFPYETRNFLFSTETHTETLYCATAEFDFIGIQSPTRRALIQVAHASNGSERLVANISKYSHLQCRNANYGPFPELEQARARRRKALGKSD